MIKKTVILNSLAVESVTVYVISPNERDNHDKNLFY